MMVPPRIIVFFAMQLTATIYAANRGGLPERVAGLMMAGAAVAGAVGLYWFGLPAAHASYSLMIIDGLLMVGLGTLALRANRFWPMWIAGLQLLSLGFHIVKELEPDILPAVYNRAVGKIAYPMIALLVIGTFRHVRRIRAAPESDWSAFIW